MKRRSKVLLLGFMICLLLSGCASVITLNDQENAEIGQYVAGKLLSYSEDYPDRLITDPELLNGTESGDGEAPVESTKPAASVKPVESQTPVSSLKPVSSTKPLETTQSQVSPEPEESVAPAATLAEIYPSKEYAVKYQGFVCCTEYPKGQKDYLIEAEPGEQLFVVDFGVKNLSSQQIEVQLGKEGIVYQLQIPDAAGVMQEYYADMAILENGGLRFLDTKIAQGKTEIASLIFNVPKECDTSRATIYMTRDEKVCEIPVK